MSIMKKIVVVFVLGLVVAGLIVLLNRQTTYNTIGTDRLQLAGTYEELEDVADVIVRAKIGYDKENVVIKSKYDDNIIINGYTVTQIDIVEVYKGENCANTLCITEEYYTINSLIGKEIWSQGSYLPAREGEEYILFLKKYDDDSKFSGMYFPVDLEYGKYVITNPAKRSVSSLELKNDASYEMYLKFYDQVQKKYIEP